MAWPPRLRRRLVAAARYVGRLAVVAIPNGSKRERGREHHQSRGEPSYPTLRARANGIGCALRQLAGAPSGGFDRAPEESFVAVLSPCIADELQVDLASAARA